MKTTTERSAFFSPPSVAWGTTDAPAPPTLPPLEGWIRIDDTADRPFGLGPVSIVTQTAIYEDTAIREHVPAAADGP